MGLEDYPMSDITIPLGQYATFQLAGSSDIPALPSGTPTPLVPGASSVKVGDFTNFYVADLGPDPSGVGRKVAVVPINQPGTGQKLTTSLTCNGKDAASGVPLATATFSVEVDGNAPPSPSASNFGIFGLVFGPLSGAPANPGSDTIVF
jgi:hypothetical protein